MRKTALLLFACLVLFAVAAQAQFQVRETLITATDTATDSYSEPRYEHPSSPHTMWYFKAKVTAITANSVALFIETYDQVDDEWDYWMNGCGVQAAPGECILLFMSTPSTTDHDGLLVGTCPDCEISKIHLMPMPLVWRVRMVRNGASTSSYTVTHWRY